MYSTCTVTLAENEEQVAWALKTFPCLTLQPQVISWKQTDTHTNNTHTDTFTHLNFPVSQEPHIGAEGMLGAGLSTDQRRLPQRFSPELSWAGPPPVTLPSGANTDTIGFFIAKFLKS